MRALAPKQNQPEPHTSSSRTRSTSEWLPQTEAEELGPSSVNTAATTHFAHDFGQIPVYAKAPRTIQRKLTVNSPGDVYEQEADRVAQQVMWMPEPCHCGGSCSSCQERNREPERLQAKRMRDEEIGVTEAPPIVQEVLGSPGRALGPGTRAFMEPRFGHDFSHVRVHTDTRSALSARAVGALAYTVGRDIVFGGGAYSPESITGKSLLAHELTHVVQQGRVQADLPRSYNGVTVGAMAGRVVQRQPQSARAFAALTLSTISCVIPDDAVGGDEVYITVNGRKVWGTESMDPGDVKAINQRIEFGSEPLVIRVFDEELWPLSDDQIGSVTIPVPQSEEEIRNAPSFAILSTNGVYRLFFQVHRV